MSRENDYSELVNPVQIEHALREISNRIAKGVRVIDERTRTYKDAKRAFDQAFARAVLAAEGPVATKKYHAVLATVAEQEALDVADAALDFAKATARALEKELDSLRSIGASTRTMYGISGV